MNPAGQTVGPRGVVRTVLGDIDPLTAGPTLIHEHLILSLTCDWRPELHPEVAAQKVRPESLADVKRNVGACYDDLILNDLETMTAEVRRFAQVGGGTIVEVTSNGIGRDVQALAWIARASQVNIVAGCGYYSRQSHPPGLDERSVQSLASEMVREIREGVAGTGIRAGVIGELGATDPLHPVERRVLRAAARAQRATGAGIVAHAASSAASPFVVANVLRHAGAWMEKVVISHVDARFGADVDSYRRLAATGCKLGFDTFGRQLYYRGSGRQHPSDAERITAILRLWDEGLGERILLAQDICARHELRSMGGQGYGHVMVDIVPRLLGAGLPTSAIETMLATTPAAFLSLDAEVS